MGEKLMRVREDGKSVQGKTKGEELEGGGYLEGMGRNEDGEGELGLLYSNSHMVGEYRELKVVCIRML